MLIFGESEIRYLESLDAAARVDALRLALTHDFPCVLITGGFAPPAELVAEAERARAAAAARPPSPTPTAIAKLTLDSRGLRWPSASILHAVLMDVLGLGVLIAGESGIGKSECALDLIVRGHRLVADDTVEVRRRAETILIGTCPELTRHHMELRGLGVINVKELFGIASTRSSKRVELVVQLERWDPAREYERLGLDDEFYEILGPPRPADSHAGRARAQRRHSRRGRGAQPAAARARPPRGARCSPIGSTQRCGRPAAGRRRRTTTRSSRRGGERGEGAEPADAGSARPASATAARRDASRSSS